MIDRPIIFSAPMVRALLDGRKTMTRRVLKWQPGDLDQCFQMDDGSWHHCASDGTHMSPLDVPYAPGDRLWVREAFGVPGGGEGCCYRATWQADGWEVADDAKWSSSIHMPRRLSRLTLTVTEVKVERVQDISAAEALAEGLPFPALREFERLWDSLNAERGFPWADNPWVVVIRFTVEQRNIDA